MKAKRLYQPEDFQFDIPTYCDMLSPDFLTEFDKETHSMYRWFFISDDIAPRKRQLTQQHGVYKSHKVLTQKYHRKITDENKSLQSAEASASVHSQSNKNLFCPQSCQTKPVALKQINKTLKSHSVINLQQAKQSLVTSSENDIT